jgi:HTH-type transcriptional regulator/antitoxin HipB
MPTADVRRFRDLGVVIRAVRESRGLNQEELAKDLAFSRDYLRALEEGKPTLYATRLFRTLNALGIRIDLTYSLEPSDD